MTKSRSFRHHNNSNAANFDKRRESISNSGKSHKGVDGFDDQLEMNDCLNFICVDDRLVADPQSVIGHGMENYMTSLDRIDRENGTDDPSHIPASPMVFRKV